MNNRSAPFASSTFAANIILVLRIREMPDIVININCYTPTLRPISFRLLQLVVHSIRSEDPVNQHSRGNRGLLLLQRW
jgi:hypothetical protein